MKFAGFITQSNVATKPLLLLPWRKRDAATMSMTLATASAPYSRIRARTWPLLLPPMATMDGMPTPFILSFQWSMTDARYDASVAGAAAGATAPPVGCGRTCGRTLVISSSLSSSSILFILLLFIFILLLIYSSFSLLLSFSSLISVGDWVD